ncbi:MAG: hypothetical protein GF313_04090 [Caldithrix sp.]|nr:hypothetical protein [Caldithrix sp.]
MASCSQNKSLLKKLFADEINGNEKKQLYEHARHCADCRSMINVYEQLKEPSNVLPMPDETAFLQMRRRLIRQIRNKPTASAINRMLDNMWLWFRQPTVAYGLSLVLLFSGWFIGRQTATQSEPAVQNGFIRTIEYSARQNTSLSESINSPYIFSDVKINALDEQTVNIRFNVSTHMEITRPKSDPLVKEVLAQSLLQNRTVGNRLQAIAYSNTVMDDKIKEALIQTMRQDDNAAVRLKALQSLLNYPGDETIQQAMLNVLTEEETVQMRLQALDYLTRNQISAGRLQSQLQHIEGWRSIPVLRKADHYFEGQKIIE